MIRRLLIEPTSAAKLAMSCGVLMHACGGEVRDYGPNGAATASSITATEVSTTGTSPTGAPDPATSSVGTSSVGTSSIEPAGNSTEPANGDTDVSASETGATSPPTTDEVACPPETRLCGSTCVSITDAAACGSDCVACPIPSGGSATCDGAECHIACDSGLQPCGETCIPSGSACNPTCPEEEHVCGAQCTPADNPDACGDDCEVCPLPDGAERAICESGACAFQCRLGSHACGADCKADDDASACGKDCKSCPAGENQTADCINGECTVSCNEGTHLCDAACVSNTEPAHCGNSCQPCVTPTDGSVSCESGQCVPLCPSNTQLCLGACIPLGDACDGQCPTGQHECDGVCRSDTSPASCGDSCTACPLPSGATSASCTQGSCDFTCGPGTTQCGSECLPNTGPAECGAQCLQLPGPRLAVIPAGDLLVGADDLEFAKVRVQSHFDTFCIDQTEVTVADYKACVDAGECQTPRSLSGCNWGVGGLENHPVTCIDWARADAYCSWAGKRLPSEWEWEFAARGPSGNAYPWGNDAPSSQHLNWRYEAEGGVTTSVGSYPAGQTLDTHVFDMAGNVWEWTGSVWCDSKAAGAACQQGVYTARGGSFGSTYDIHVRAAWRDADSAGDHRFGFRCAFGTVNP